MTVHIFLGPTLSVEEARAELHATYLPPASQGDVYRSTLQKPVAIGVIDGVFELVPSVWHKEILYAMSEGIHVFGASSMGALRAAELEPFGMEGVGAVFEAYRDGRLEDDDEVAVRHGSAETGYLLLSEAMVNIRATLAVAERQGAVSPLTRQKLERLAKDLYYPERSYPRILARAGEVGLPNDDLELFGAWLPGGRVDQKRADAVAVLRTIRARLEAGLEPKHVSYRLEHTKYWQRVLDQANKGATPPELWRAR
jgi:hypothetical protein